MLIALVRWLVALRSSRDLYFPFTVIQPRTLWSIWDVCLCDQVTWCHKYVQVCFCTTLKNDANVPWIIFFIVASFAGFAWKVGWIIHKDGSSCLNEPKLLLLNSAITFTFSFDSLKFQDFFVWRFNYMLECLSRSSTDFSADTSELTCLCMFAHGQHGREL